MKLESLSVAIRPRFPYEAIDCGLKLVQEYRLLIYTGWSIVLIPLLIAVSGYIVFCPEQAWIGLIIIWWLKPLYERIILFILSRVLFGEKQFGLSALKACWNECKPGLIRALTWQRLSLRRSFLLPIWQLEKTEPAIRSRRIKLLLAKNTSSHASWLGWSCAYLESALMMAFIVMAYMAIPSGMYPDEARSLHLWLSSPSLSLDFLEIAAYTFSMLLIEPLYVAGGFALYLNRRTELEGWDIELGFRRLATRLASTEPSC